MPVSLSSSSVSINPGGVSLDATTLDLPARGVSLNAGVSIAVGESVAMQGLDAIAGRGGDGFYVDFTADSMAIRHAAATANSYDGLPSGRLTYTGSPSTGPNGGLVVSLSSKYASIPLTAFPWTFTAGTMAVELVRGNVTSFAHFLSATTGAGSDNITIRTGGSAANFRLIVSGAATLDPGTRIYTAVPHCIVATYATDDFAVSYDGRQPLKDVSGAVPATATDLFIGGSGGAADYAEILRVWYIPSRMANVDLVERSKPKVLRKIYVDAVAGNDSNDGISSGASKLTINGAAGGLSGESGAKFRHCDELVLNGHFRETPIAPPNRIVFSALDASNRPVIDGSRAISAGAWAADGTYPNVYVATITHETATSSPSLFYPMLFWGDLIGRDRDQCWSISTTSVAVGTGSKAFTVAAGRDFRVGDRVLARNSTATPRYMLGTVTGYSGTTLAVNVTTTQGSGSFAAWTIKVTNELIGRWGGADIAANRAALTPGSFTCHKSGSTTQDPKMDSAGTIYVYYLYLPDGGDPATTLLEVAYAEAQNLITLNGGETLNGIIVQRTATKDMINCNNNDTYMFARTNRCGLYDAAAHAIVASPAIHVDSIAIGLRSSQEFAMGGGFHFFRDEVTSGTADTSSATRCKAISFGNAFYSHGVGGGNEQQRVNIVQSTSVDADNGIETGKTVEGWHISGHTYANCIVNGHLNFPLLDVES